MWPPTSPPPDFDGFWHATRAALARVPAAPERRREAVRGGMVLERVTFASLGGVRIGAYLISWPGTPPRPLVVHSHGYDSQCAPMWEWAHTGIDVLGVDVRGHGASAAALAEPSPSGYVLTGIESPESSVLRGAACDHVRALEVARALVSPSPSRVVLHGMSLAGALAIWTQGLTGAADLVVAGVPSFSWPEGRRLFVLAGSGAETSAYLAARPAWVEEDVMAVLRYFDTASFAERVRCPVLIGIGERDEVVPAPTVEAVAARLAGASEVMYFPVSHSDSPEERRWEAFDSRFLDLAHQGTRDGYAEGGPPSARAAASHTQST